VCSKRTVCGSCEFMCVWVCVCELMRVGSFHMCARWGLCVCYMTKCVCVCVCASWCVLDHFICVLVEDAFMCVCAIWFHVRVCVCELMCVESFHMCAREERVHVCVCYMISCVLVCARWCKLDHFMCVLEDVCEIFFFFCMSYIRRVGWFHMCAKVFIRVLKIRISYVCQFFLCQLNDACWMMSLRMLDFTFYICVLEIVISYVC